MRSAHGRFARSACKRVAHASTEAIAVRCLDRALARGEGEREKEREREWGCTYPRRERLRCTLTREVHIRDEEAKYWTGEKLDVSGDAKEGGFRLWLMWRSCGSAWTVITLLTHPYLIPGKPVSVFFNPDDRALFLLPFPSAIPASYARVCMRALIYAARRRSSYLAWWRERSSALFLREHLSENSLLADHARAYRIEEARLRWRQSTKKP